MDIFNGKGFLHGMTSIVDFEVEIVMESKTIYFVDS